MVQRGVVGCGVVVECGGHLGCGLGLFARGVVGRGGGGGVRGLGVWGCGMGVKRARFRALCVFMTWPWLPLVI